jgi:hypothetical protein
VKVLPMVCPSCNEKLKVKRPVCEKCDTEIGSGGSQHRHNVLRPGTSYCRHSYGNLDGGRQGNLRAGVYSQAKVCISLFVCNLVACGRRRYLICLLSRVRLKDSVPTPILRGHRHQLAHPTQWAYNRVVWTFPVLP